MLLDGWGRGSAGTEDAAPAPARGWTARVARPGCLLNPRCLLHELLRRGACVLRGRALRTDARSHHCPTAKMCESLHRGAHSVQEKVEIQSESQPYQGGRHCVLVSRRHVPARLHDCESAGSIAKMGAYATRARAFRAPGRGATHQTAPSFAPCVVKNVALRCRCPQGP